MLDSPCRYKQYSIYSLTIMIGYIGYTVYKKYISCNIPKKNYIAGGVSPINIECEKLKKTVQTFLTIYYDYTDNFTFLYGTQQVVNGIKYNINIENKDNKVIVLNFIHRPWLEGSEIFENLDNTTE